MSNDAKLFIPKKKVTINPHEPLWITCNIKRKNRQRKRLYSVGYYTKCVFTGQ